MFNSSSWQSHAEYRINFKNMKANFPSQLRSIPWDSYSREREKLMSLNLDPVGEYLSGFYSHTGRPAENQVQILRSLILFALPFNRTDARLSLTVWVNDVLPQNPVFIALIGCCCARDLPPLGSYYDFMNRLWNADRNSYSRSSLLPAGKNGRKPKRRSVPAVNLLNLNPKLLQPKSLQTAFSKVKTSLTSARVSCRMYSVWLLYFLLLKMDSSPRTDLPFPGMAQLLLSTPVLMAERLNPLKIYLKGFPLTVYGITLTPMPSGDGTATKTAGISETPFTCSAAAARSLSQKSPPFDELHQRQTP